MRIRGLLVVFAIVLIVANLILWGLIVRVVIGTPDNGSRHQKTIEAIYATTTAVKHFLEGTLAARAATTQVAK